MTLPPIPVPVIPGAIFHEDFVGVAGTPPNPKVWDLKHFKSPSGCQFDPALVRLNGKGQLEITAVRQADGSWRGGQASSAYAPAISGPRWVEARAKVPAGFGTFSAPIWEDGYPWGGKDANGFSLEVDVCEQLGKEPTIYHATIHNWAGTHRQSGTATQMGVTLSDGFHRYGAAIYPGRVDYYFDRIRMASRYGADIGIPDITVPQVCANIDLDMGGSWAGTPTISGPAVLLVDYYRAYALKAAA